MSRPILIDPADGPCEYCTAWVQKPGPHRCNICNKVIAVYENMAGHGFSSPLPHHFHLVQVLGYPGREAIHSELCLGCYREAFTAAYPDAKLPIAPQEMPPPNGHVLLGVAK